MIQAAKDKDFGNHMRQLDELLQEVEAIGDCAVRDRTGRIIQGLMDFHGAGIARMLERLAEMGEPGRQLIEELASDEPVSSLLLLYGLHPLDIETRVRLALDQVRPYLASHGGNVELLGVSEEGVARLHMQGSCNGCPSSAVTLKSMIEQAIYGRAPDVTGIETDDGHQDTPAKPGFVPVERLIKTPKRHLQGTAT